jgi:AraC-like DNA-binding protein
VRITAPAITEARRLGSGLPTWPPLLATRGVGSLSSGHAHHAMHLVLAVEGSLRVRAGARGAWTSTAGVLTAPDVAHAIDARERETLLVFLDPESEVGRTLRASVKGPLRRIGAEERDVLVGVDPHALMGLEGPRWTSLVARTLGAGNARATRPVHPRVRVVLRHLAKAGRDDDVSLEALAAVAEISPGRLMHAFTESIGIPLRRYLAWLRLQRAAATIVGGAPLAEAALTAGFSDAAHMSRTFRAMLGMTPSSLQEAALARVISPRTS